MGLQFGVKDAELGGILALLRLSQLALDLAQPLVTVEHVIHRQALEVIYLLAHVGDAPVWWQGAVTGVRCQLSEQQGEQARLAGTIGAQQADFLAGVQGQTGVLQQAQGAALQGQGFDLYHGAEYISVEGTRDDRPDRLRRLVLSSAGDAGTAAGARSEEHTSELQSRENLVCRLLLEKKKEAHN